MLTSTILFLSLFFLFGTGQSIRDIASNGVCDLNAIVRIGEVLRWRNPTNRTLYISDVKCHKRMNIVIPPEQTATYVFQIRGICQYHSSACSDLGILKVRGRIQRRSTSGTTACTDFCNGTQLKPEEITSSNLCRYQYDYVIRGVVDRYHTQANQTYVEISVKHDYLQPVCQSNCITTTSNYKLSFLWMLSSQNCTCSRLNTANDILVMGFRSGTEFAFDTRSKKIKWDSTFANNLLIYQQKVNKDPPCS